MSITRLVDPADGGWVGKRSTEVALKNEIQYVKLPTKLSRHVNDLS